MSQPVGLAYGGQPWRVAAIARRLRLGAEEEKVLGQALGDIALPALDHAQLRKQPSGDALAEDVLCQQASCLRLEHRGRQLPQRGRLRLRRTEPQPFAEIAHAGGPGRIRPAHQREHLLLHGGAGRRIGPSRCNVAGFGQGAPAPVDGPQVCRVHPIGAGRFLDRAVLREQRQR